MGIISKTKTWADNENVTYTDINANFDGVYNEFNGNIENSNIKAGAGIEASKLDATVVETDTNQTITGTKTFDNAVFVTSTQTVKTVTDGATPPIDLSLGNVHMLTLTASGHAPAVTNGAVGKYFAVEVIQGGSGSYTLVWFSTIKWVGAVVPTLTTTVGKKDVFMFRITGTDTYDGYIVGQNI
jgi:hypothetical protein